jgi:hypothetical protein
MGIDAAGWFDWAERDPGPEWKVNGGMNGGKGMVPHSAEGYWPHLRDELWKPARRASWGASNLKNGRFIQHYPVFACTWTSGAGYPNNNFFAFENEGVAGEALTPQQTTNIIRCGKDLMARYHWIPTRPINSADKSASLYEHNECVRWGADPTACPSGRIPWGLIVPALKEVDMPLSDEDIRKIAAVVKLENTVQTNDLKGFINGRFIALIEWCKNNLAPKP